nr:nucleic acid-binding, OB-fold protein [Tanacetum cinerariifolium]
MADQRIMAQLLQAPTEGYEDAIVVPAITADNFELKHGLLTLVQNKQFFEHDKEDPHAHIRYFNKITSTLIITGFSCEQTLPWERTLDNPTSLTFGKFISLQEIPNTDFPEHYFNFVAYNELPAKVNVKNPLLTAAGSWWRVEESDMDERVDREISTLFGFARKIPPEKFSDGGRGGRRRLTGGGRQEIGSFISSTAAVVANPPPTAHHGGGSGWKSRRCCCGADGGGRFVVGDGSEGDGVVVKWAAVIGKQNGRRAAAEECGGGAAASLENLPKKFSGGGWPEEAPEFKREEEEGF